MKTFVIGDIHGAYRALRQCLERSGFDYEKDRLIVLGDVADGWREVAESFEELLKIRNLVYVRGNHDQWLAQWLEYGEQPLIWTIQGGQNSIRSYLENPELMKKHLDFLKRTKCYFMDEEKRVYVHGGIKPDTPVEETEEQYLMWDRDLFVYRHEYDEIARYKEVYVGHTSIWRESHEPLNHGNVYFMDTGGGWEGKVSIMDVKTKQFWQSDVVTHLYPGERGRY